MSSELDWLLTSHGRDGDVRTLCRLARELKESGKLRLAATALDRAWGSEPGRCGDHCRPRPRARWAGCDGTGVRLRYVPAGTFLMGAEEGEPDEQPAHPVLLDEFGIGQKPVSWTVSCGLMGWQPPPYGRPPDGGTLLQNGPYRDLLEANKIRLQ